ncbi:MAG: trimeric autotransporter adhesin, partial [Verrucomicrobiota bacterium]
MKKKHSSQSAFFNPRVLVGILFLLLLLAGLFALDLFPGASARAQGTAQNAKAGPLHKVSVSDPQLAAKLKTQGARLIADYGSFVMFEVDDAMAGSLASNRNAQIVDENNLILLNAGTIDTRTPEARAMHHPVAASPGKQMRLIQFAGP